MSTYNKIADMIPVAEQIKTIVSQSDKLESILTNFLNELIEQHGNANTAVNYYNAIQCLFDDITDKSAYDSVLAKHSRVLRTFCYNLRANIAMTESQINNTVQPGFALTAPKNTTKLIGIRKSIRVTSNMGVITPWLTDEEAEAAALSVCSWAAVNPNIIIDAGFLVAYGNKFDVLNSGCLVKIDDLTINALDSLTPKEFAVICKHLIEHLIKQYGKNEAINFLEAVSKSALDRYAKRTGDNDFRLLTEYGEKFCSINIKATTKDQWTTCVLAAKNGSLISGNNIPKESPIAYGMELLFPIAPIVSREWMNIVNSNQVISFKTKIGWVDNIMLYHAHYDCSNNIKVRLLPTVTCTFVAGSDSNSTDKIMKSSNSNTLTSAYTWKAIDTSTNDTIEFTLDDLLCKKIFHSEHSYVINPNFINISKMPNTAQPYIISQHDSEPVMLPNMRVNDMIVIISATNTTATWGQTLAQVEAEKVLALLEFMPGQEKEIMGSDKLYCRIASRPVGTVAKAILSKRNYSCIFVHIPAF